MPGISNSIRRLRFDYNKMNQEELAHKVGCPRQAIIALEAHKYTHPLLWPFE